MSTKRQTTQSTGMWIRIAAGAFVVGTILFAGCSSTGVSRPAGVTENDKNLATVVYGRLRRDVALNAQAISVSVDNGVVTLAGFAADMSQSAQAEAIARSTPGGVTDVVNNLQIRAWDDDSLGTGFTP